MGKSRQKSRTTRKGVFKSDQILKKPNFKPHQKPKSNDNQPAQQKQSSATTTTIPFSVYDRILLLGEGDFSFSASLVAHHGVADLWATSYDPKEVCFEKYPGSAKKNIEAILNAFDEELSDDDGSDSGHNSGRKRVIFGVDATSIGKHATMRNLAPFHRIIFNFPHTGGLSTDVNRQVRANQALLSSFFQSAIPLLSKSPSSSTQSSSLKHDHHELDPEDPEAPRPGSIIITIFESEPYTLWNVRDLARNAGLSVWRSWKFESRAFPGYRHARTVGTIVDKEGKESESAWKGEERSARCYEFGMGPWPGEGNPKRKKKKTKPGEESSSEDE